MCGVDKGRHGTRRNCQHRKPDTDTCDHFAVGHDLLLVCFAAREGKVANWCATCGNKRKSPPQSEPTHFSRAAILCLPMALDCYVLLAATSVDHRFFGSSGQSSALDRRGTLRRFRRRVAGDECRSWVKGRRTAPSLTTSAVPHRPDIARSVHISRNSERRFCALVAVKPAVASPQEKAQRTK